MNQSNCGYTGLWAQIVICVVVTSTAGTTTTSRQPWWQTPPDPRQTEEIMMHPQCGLLERREVKRYETDEG